MSVQVASRLLASSVLMVLTAACGRIGYDLLGSFAGMHAANAGAPNSAGSGGALPIGSMGGAELAGSSGDYGGSASSGAGQPAGSGDVSPGGSNATGGFGGEGGALESGGSEATAGAPAGGATSGGYSGSDGLSGSTGWAGADSYGGQVGAGGVSGGTFSGNGGTAESGGTSSASGGTAESGGTSSASGGSAESGGTSSGTGGASGGSAGASSLGDCQARTYGTGEYLFCASELTWAEARDGCASVGMHLVRIDSSEENQWVLDNNYDPGTAAQGIWIGASDGAVEGEWRWSDDTLFWVGGNTGSPQGGLFNAWYATQPSEQPRADCAAMDSNKGSTNWMAVSCTMPGVFVCES